MSDFLSIAIAFAAVLLFFGALVSLAMWLTPAPRNKRRRDKFNVIYPRR